MRIYKYTGESGNFLNRLLKKGQEVIVKSRNLAVASGKKYILKGSTNDRRSEKIPPPPISVDWKNLQQCAVKLKRMKPIHWNKIKSYCKSVGLKLKTVSEGTRGRIQNVSDVMDLAFDCGWTGELDALDNKSGLKKAIAKITNKETTNVSKPSKTKDKGSKAVTRKNTRTGNKAKPASSTKRSTKASGEKPSKKTSEEGKKDEG